MLSDDERPFAGVIANFIVFRQQLVNHKLISVTLESSRASRTQVVVTQMNLTADDLFTEISISEVDGEPPLHLCGYLQVRENTGHQCRVCVMKATHGANNADIEMDEIYLDASSIPDYLNKFYAYLVTGNWD